MDHDDKSKVDIKELKNRLATGAEQIIKGDKEVQQVMAAEVVQTLQDSIEMTNIADIMLDREDFGLNEVPKYILRKEGFAYIHSPGSWAPMTQPRNVEFTLPFEMMSAHIMLPLQQLRSGRFGAVADQLADASRMIQAKVNKMVIDTFIGAVPSTTGHGNYTAAAGTSVTQSELNAAIEQVEDETSGARVIAGRRSKISAIMDFNTNISNGDPGIWGDLVKDEIQRTGAMAIYRSLPLAGWKQYKTRDGRATLDELSMWVVGQDVGRIAYQESFQFLDDIEVGTLNWHIHAWIMVGAAIFFPERVHRIVLTG